MIAESRFTVIEMNYLVKVVNRVVGETLQNSPSLNHDKLGFFSISKVVL